MNNEFEIYTKTDDDIERNFDDIEVLRKWLLSEEMDNYFIYDRTVEISILHKPTKRVYSQADLEKLVNKKPLTLNCLN